MRSIPVDVEDVEDAEDVEDSFPVEIHRRRESMLQFANRSFRCFSNLFKHRLPGGDLVKLNWRLVMIMVMLLLLSDVLSQSVHFWIELKWIDET